MRKLTGMMVLLAGGWMLAQTVVVAQPGGQKRRVKPKEFDQKTVSNVFFEDVFSVLVGQRPTPATGVPSQRAPAAPGAAPDDGSTEASFPWSQIISATTLEDEIKSIKPLVDESVTTPADFRARGYKDCRQHFSMAALMFAIIGQYEGDVRWKKDAPGARDAFARTAANAKVGTTQVYNEAKLRKLELQDLIGGQTWQGQQGQREVNWEQLVDRSPLMKRLEQGQQGRLQPWTASRTEFSRHKEKVLHEAELIAAISEVLIMEGMEDADDQEYAGFAKRMKTAALNIVEGTGLDNYDMVSQNLGEVSKSCSECHELYR